MHNKYNTVRILPPTPDGCEERSRYIDGAMHRQYFGCGGFFHKDQWTKGTSGMTQHDLCKVGALTIDVDAYDWDGAAERWGADRKTRKAAMKAAHEDEVIQWMKDVSFRDVVAEECEAVGLPPMPNVVIYTGHGLCLVYWLSDDIGWKDNDLNAEDWTPAHLKAVIKRFHGHNPDMWWWDASAKDVGTRLFPLPGGQHRDTGKVVRVIGACDDQYDMKRWFNDLKDKYPGNPAKTKTPRKKGAKAKTSSGGPSQSWWSRRAWLPFYPDLDEGERDTCPLCGGSGYKRMPEHYACFSCQTHFIIPAKPKTPTSNVVNIPLDKNGYMCLPKKQDNFVVMKAATGSGKTRELARRSKAHQKGWFFHKKVLCVVPHISLAEGAAARLSIKHASAGNDGPSLKTDSIACCFASLSAKANLYSRQELEHVIVFIDEPEACFSQTQTMLSPENAQSNYNRLKAICLHAEQVVLCDQNAGEVTQRFIDDVNADRVANGKPPHPFRWYVTDIKKHDFEYIAPVYRTDGNGNLIVVETSHSCHLTFLMDEIAAGKKPFIYCFSKRDCLALERRIRTLYPTLDVRVVVGSKSKESKNDLSQAGLTADVLIYNNAMCTGVSYEVPDHYDNVHMLLSKHAQVSGDMAEQAAHRNRCPKSKKIYISGSERAPINDWRCDFQQHLDRAVRLMNADERVAQAIQRDPTYRLRSDYMVSDDAKRMSVLQAKVVASGYVRGRGWAIEYLRTRHTFTERQSAPSVTDHGDAFRQAKQAVKLDAAIAVAASQPLDDVDLDRVNECGADTDDEANAAQAARMVRYYGDAYENADDEGKVGIVLQHEKGLFKKVDVYAQARCYDDLAKAQNSVSRLKTSIAKSTEQRAALRLATALLFKLTLEAVEALPGNGIEVILTPAQALAIVNNMSKYARLAGLKLRDDRQANPIQQVGQWLRLGNVKLSKRMTGPRNARTRQYYLSSSVKTYMNQLSQKRFDDLSAPDLKTVNFEWVA